MQALALKSKMEAAFLGRYEVLDEVGAGGFGTVYRARQLTTGQVVAIKVLRIPEDLAQERVERRLARFAREMRLCAKLHHPNIVRLIDSGQADNGIVYSVFEFVPGMSLEAVLAVERRLHPIEARRLMSQVLDALACAHAQGVVHRDLKPANIMVVSTGARRNAVVLDFGIGAMAEGAGREELRLTNTNEWVGSPRYSAPEQLLGKRPLPRSDLYSWGLMFLECLTGKRPFDGVNVAQVLFRQLSPERVEVPAELAVHPLGRILMRVTAKDPEARVATAEGLLSELEACDVSGLFLGGGAAVSGAAVPEVSVTATLWGEGSASAGRDVLSKEGALSESGVRVGQGGGPGRESTGGATVRDLPLVGRHDELDMLMARWDKTRGGAGQAVLITGEPGIGKSRLTRAFREELRGEAHTYFEGRCAEDATASPFYAIVDLLNRLLDPGRELSPAAKAERLAELLSSHGFELDEAVPLFALLLSMPLPDATQPVLTNVSPQRLREMTRNAVLSLLFEAGERAPVAVVFEDMHWVDPSTLELCAELVREASSARVCVLFTGRPEFSPPWSPSSALIVKLSPLDRPDVAQMAALVTGGRSLTPEVIERIATRTDGVPLFLEELVQSMLEAGVLVEPEEPSGALALAGSLDDLGVPRSLQDLVMARLSRLGRAKETAQVAAAVGREFGIELLRATLGGDEEALREDLDKLVAADIVHRKRRPRGAAYVFKHALVQDAAHASMRKPHRREIHERIARALERDFPEVAEEQPERMARHLTQAELIEQATGYLLRGGQRAFRRGAYAEAISLLKRGLALLHAMPEGPGRALLEIDLRSALGYALIPGVGFCAPDVMDNFGRARALCDQRDDPDRLFPSLYGLWITNLAADRREPAEAYAEQVFDLAQAHPDSFREVRGYVAVGMTHFYRGRLEQARAALSRAIELSTIEVRSLIVREFGGDDVVWPFYMCAWIEVFTGQADQARASIDALLRLSESLKSSLMMTMAEACAVSIYRDLRDVERTTEFAEKTLATAAEQGFLFWRSHAICGRGWARSMRGDHERGAAEIEEGLSFVRLIRQSLSLTHLGTWLVEAYLRAGRFEEGLRAADEALAASATGVNTLHRTEHLRLQGELLAAMAGREDAGAPWFEQAIELAREHGAAYNELLAATSLARARRAMGDVGSARAVLGEAVAKIHEGFDIPAYIEAAALFRELSGEP